MIFHPFHYIINIGGKFMNELMEKYASVLLESCLRVEKDQPLFISFNIERIDFIMKFLNVYVLTNVRPKSRGVLLKNQCSRSRSISR